VKQQRTPLPIIVGSGGISPAGRVSFDQAYRRMVIDALPEAKREAYAQQLGQAYGFGQRWTLRPRQRDTAANS
jgi:acetoacetyl-[acyl-carrier protein] synthase